MFGRYADKFRLQLFNTTLFALWTLLSEGREGGPSWNAYRRCECSPPPDYFGWTKQLKLISLCSQWTSFFLGNRWDLRGHVRSVRPIVSLLRSFFFCLIIYAIARINFLNWRKKARRGATRNEEIRTSSVILRITFFCGSDNLWRCGLQLSPRRHKITQKKNGFLA